MANDPAFLFYPGDYLRDTQCLSEKAQVAYDRIMCEHMRNICISQQQLNFFTKRLSEDEKTEVFALLKSVDGGFQISWVAESISKRKSYSASRRKNRTSKSDNICKTYVPHMENEIVIENEIEIGLEECKAEVLKDQVWVDTACMSLGVLPAALPSLIDKFIAKLKERRVKKKKVSDFAGHFVNKTRLILQSNKNGNNSQSNQKGTASSASFPKRRPEDYGYNAARLDPTGS